MFRTPEANCSALRHVAFAASVAFIPTATQAESPERAILAIAADGAAVSAEVSPPPSVVIGRAMDLVGTPMSMVPKYQPVSRPAARKFAGGPASLPGGAPLGANRITSGFGYRSHPVLGGYRLHSGIDMAAPTGSRVYATMDGYISHADWAGGYGLSVRLIGSNAVETRYGHLASVAVDAGNYVRKGDLLGFVGSTGMSTGPHLHYEVRVNGRPVDPRGAGRN